MAPSSIQATTEDSLWTSTSVLAKSSSVGIRSDSICKSEPKLRSFAPHKPLTEAEESDLSRPTQIWSSLWKESVEK